MSDAIVHLSSLVGSPLLDSAGEQLGRVEDLVVRLDGPEERPPVIGVKARIGGRSLFVPSGRVEALEPAAVRVGTTKLDLAQFERRPGEVLLAEDLLDRSLINVRTARLVTAREVELAHEQGAWRVAGIDPSFAPRMWRLLPRRFRGHDSEHAEFVAWEEMEPLVGHVPHSRLSLAGGRLRRLHPAQIADLVEAASHAEGAEILQAVGENKEYEADVFEELDHEHQIEFIKDRSDEEIADVLARMAPDDAVDLLLELKQERRRPVLALLPAGRQQKIHSLLGHNPSTAGGLMNPDFVSVPADGSAGEALARVRGSDLDASYLSTVCAIDAAGRLSGVLSLATLIRASVERPLGELIDGPGPAVAADVDLPEVAQLMSDYNLIALPVLDPDGRPIGVIAVDDILEQLIPEEWRRRAGSARE
jgi:CBS domain-containing protein